MKIERVFHLTTFTEEERTRPRLRYWLSRPPAERLAAVEFLRRQVDGSRTRLRRVYRVLNCPWRGLRLPGAAALLVAPSSDGLAMSPVVNKLKRPLVKYEDAANPEAWRAVGRRLMTSAEFLWVPLNEAIDGFVATRGDRSPEQAAKYAALAGHFGAFFVLAGFAVENYLKAHLLASQIASVKPFRDGKEAIDFVMDRQTPAMARRKSHDLVALANAANVLTPKNRPLLERLTAHVLWAGRYPVPLEASDALFERTTRDRDLAEIKALLRDL